MNVHDSQYCGHCRALIQYGRPWTYTTGVFGGDRIYLHRACVEGWLDGCKGGCRVGRVGSNRVPVGGLGDNPGAKDMSKRNNRTKFEPDYG